MEKLIKKNEITKLYYLFNNQEALKIYNFSNQIFSIVVDSDGIIKHLVEKENFDYEKLINNLLLSKNQDVAKVLVLEKKDFESLIIKFEKFEKAAEETFNTGTNKDYNTNICFIKNIYYEIDLNNMKFTLKLISMLNVFKQNLKFFQNYYQNISLKKK